MNLYTKQKQTHSKQTYGYQRGKGGVNKEYGINRYKLLKQISNKDLLCSTGDSIQYLVITYNGKESDIYIDR